MAFSRPTLEELKDRILSDFESRMTGAVPPFVRRSIIRIMAFVMAGGINLVYGFLDWIADQIFISSSDEDELDTWATAYGVVRRAAQKATGEVTFLGDVAATAIPLGTEFYRDTDDERYVTTEAATLGTVANEDGKFVATGVSFEASTAGANGNDEGSITLYLTTAIANIDNEVTVSSAGITNGSDEESDTSLRERVAYRKKYPSHGGSEYDYIAWAKEVAGVTRAWYYPNYNGPGTGALAFTRDEEATTILPTATQRTAVYDYIVEHSDPATGETIGLPTTAEPGFQVLELTFLDVDFSIDIDPYDDDTQDAIEAELEDLIYREGGPGNTLEPSRISEVISGAQGEVRHRLDSPTSGVTALMTQVHRLGTITWGGY